MQIKCDHCGAVSCMAVPTSLSKLSGRPALRRWERLAGFRPVKLDPTGLLSHLAHDAKSVIPQHKRFLFTAGTYKNMGIARY